MSDQNDSGKELESVALFLFAFIVLIYLAWYQWGHYITNVAVMAALYLVEKTNEIYPLLPQNETAQSVFFFFVSDVFVTDQKMVVDALNRVDVYHPSFAEGYKVLSIVGYFFRFPVAITAICATITVYRHSRPSQLRRTFNIYSLADYCVKYFPQIRPALNEKLLKKSFDQGPHRQEVSPIRFAILNGALTIKEDQVEYTIRFGKGLKRNKNKKIFTIQDSYDEDEGLPVVHKRCELNLKPIRKLFVEQITHLGRWSGAENLPPYARALYAVFLLYIKGGENNKKKALELIKQYNRTFKLTKQQKKDLTFDTTGVDEIIEQYEDSVAVRNVIKKHTFTTTVLVALFYRATNRRAKLPPSQFYWLKEVNRTLWYALHQNMSPAAWTEAAGCRGIFLTEQKLAAEANYPFTDNAIRGYLDHINDEGWLLTQPDKLSELAV